MIAYVRLARLLAIFSLLVCPVSAESLLKLRNAAGELVAEVTEGGALWTTGKQHWNQLSIALESDKKYWSVKNDEGQVVLAINLENGELFSLGDMFPAYLDYGEPISHALLSLSREGQIQFQVTFDGSVLMRESEPLPFIPIPPSPSPMPAPAGEPGSIDWSALAVSLNIPLDSFVCVSQPHAQGRIYYAPLDNYYYPDLSQCDTTDKHWRLPYNREYVSLSQYHAQVGWRYRDRENNNYLKYGIYAPHINPSHAIIFEHDTKIWKSSQGHISYSVLFDRDWNSEWQHKRDGQWAPFLNRPGVHDIRNALTDYGTGTEYQPQVVDPVPSPPFSRLSLYTMRFFRPNRIPSEHDYPVPVGCVLEPYWTPGVERIELVIYDPAEPAMKRILHSSSGERHICQYWDGKLYYQGDENMVPTYPSMGDVFLNGLIYWTPTNGPGWQGWEIANDNPSVMRDEHVAVAAYPEGIDWPCREIIAGGIDTIAHRAIIKTYANMNDQDHDYSMELSLIGGEGYEGYQYLNYFVGLQKRAILRRHNGTEVIQAGSGPTTMTLATLNNEFRLISSNRGESCHVRILVPGTEIDKQIRFEFIAATSNLEMPPKPHNLNTVYNMSFSMTCDEVPVEGHQIVFYVSKIGLSNGDEFSFNPLYPTALDSYVRVRGADDSTIISTTDESGVAIGTFKIVNAAVDRYLFEAFSLDARKGWD